jgi:spore coat polysaccharide biosynthesis protein SpsF (cytidylyltransferase family)
MSFSMVVVGIQSRISSSRLPCKALLELADTTILGMCIERSKNAGYPVYLLTSDCAEDDLIAESASRHQVAGIIRGSLDNVLSRYMALAEDVSCDYIVRVTADNPLTECGFIDPLIHYVLSRNLQYACMEPSLCPEGTNIEIFSRQALLESALNDNSNVNLEHVTPYMKRDWTGNQYLKETALRYFPLDCKSLSFTIDTPSDYIYMAKLINFVMQKLGIGWQSPEFVQACAKVASNPSFPHAKGRNHSIK